MTTETDPPTGYLFPALPGQPTSRDEPIPISAALGTQSRDDFIAATEAEAARYPGAYYTLGVCRHCDKSLGDGPDAKVIPLGAFGFLANVCCQACSDKGKQRIKDEYEEAERARYAALVPAEFVIWDERKGNNEARSAVMGRFGFDTRRGMMIHGPTGTCKTRLLWELAKLVASQPTALSWAFVDSYDAATQGFPADARKVKFLFIDDLGNEPTSHKFESAFLRLMRWRNDHHLPVFVTTQLSGVQFKARFFHGPAGDAILRRLGERSDKVAT